MSVDGDGDGVYNACGAYDGACFWLEYQRSASTTNRSKASCPMLEFLAPRAQLEKLQTPASSFLFGLR